MPVLFRRGLVGGRNPRAWLAVSGWVFFAILILLSCRSSTDPDSQPALSLDLDAVPTLLKSDSTETATIWATVLEHGNPAADSTLVSFVATLGTVDPEAYTRDGLARVIFTPGAEAGVAVVVAQVRAVRDTVLLTIY